jgi:hypothetical protein
MEVADEKVSSEGCSGGQSREEEEGDKLGCRRMRGAWNGQKGS